MHKSCPRAAAAALFCLLALVAGPAQSKEAKGGPNLGAFIKEGMVLDIQGNQTQMAIWMPYEFFIASDTASGDTRTQAERDLGFLKPYAIVLVECSRDAAGGTRYDEEADVRARARLRFADGSEARPLVHVPTLVAAAAAAMKTAIASNGDADSTHMYLLIFPNTNGKGRPRAGAAQAGKLTLTLSKTPQFAPESLVWHTPFEALSSARAR